MTIIEVLNYWNSVGVFSYVIPFLLLFAVVFGILEKSKIFENNKSVNTIVAAAVGLLALQFEIVPIFFANIFPKMGVGLAAILVILLFLGFVGIKADGTSSKGVKAIGIIGAILVISWAFSDFLWFGSYGGNLGWWFEDYIWSLLILAAVVGSIVWVSRSGSAS